MSHYLVLSTKSRDEWHIYRIVIINDKSDIQAFGSYMKDFLIRAMVVDAETVATYDLDTMVKNMIHTFIDNFSARSEYYADDFIGGTERYYPFPIKIEVFSQTPYGRMVEF